jgi:hypothetical protein
MPRTRSLPFLFLFLLAVAPLRAQQCPVETKTGPSYPSESRTLEGQLIYHNGLRQWFELRLDKPECSQSSIQLIAAAGFAQGYSSDFEILRGCRVTANGTLDEAMTGYYSLDLFQSVSEIKPIEPCAKKPPLRHYENVKPDFSIRNYRVEIRLKVSPGDHPIAFKITSNGKKLKPWQAYASYLFTGNDVLYGECADGYLVDTVFGNLAANPGHSGAPGEESDQATFFPLSEATEKIKTLHLGYTCERHHTRPKPEKHGVKKSLIYLMTMRRYTWHVFGAEVASARTSSTSGRPVVAPCPDHSS